MCDINKWKKIKRSGAFRRKVKKCVTNLLFNPEINNLVAKSSSNVIKTSGNILSPPSNDKTNKPTINTNAINTNDNVEILETENNDYKDNWLLEMEEGEEVEKEEEEEVEVEEEREEQKEEKGIFKVEERNIEFRRKLRIWAVSNNISHSTLKELFTLINARCNNILPVDPRTFLKTQQTVIITKVGNGNYWHNGLEFCMKQALSSLDAIPDIISININVDGLPVYKSSKCEFWPILFNIYEKPELKPMIIGIYCGKGKPSDLTAFLQPFVEECKIILSEGLIFNGKNITIKIRSFICDSPARAFIKGVTNFNGKQGCLKCTTVGEYSHVSHTVFFPRSGCEKRTNNNFRAKMYGSHHKQETPLTLLPINMIEDFPVGDSLHLIDLGIMKKCLMGWRDGSFGNYKTKWCARDILIVSKFLENCKMPREIHRSVRGLDVLAHWKASEYHTFLHYLGIVILKDILPSDVYYHFLLFFCAVTICSSTHFSHFLNLAEILLNNYVEYYRDFYGEDYITSNVHNLTHLVDEVKKFGNLSTFNAYPFENRLYQIKNLLRNGNLPLSQVAKRISEIVQCEHDILKTTAETKLSNNFPLLKNKNIDGYFTKIELCGFALSNNIKDKWFMKKDNSILAMKYAFIRNDEIYIKTTPVTFLQDVFDSPIKSSYLYIFKSMSTCNTEGLSENCKISDIKCKIVAVEHGNETTFIPLLHTLKQ